MKVLAVGHRLVIRPHSLEEHDQVFASAKAAGIELPKIDKRRHQVSVDEGVVLEVGPSAFIAFYPNGVGEPWCKVGDIIAYTKSAGKFINTSDDAEEYVLVINDEDVVAVLKEKAND